MLMMLEECKRRFPHRYQRVRDNFSLMSYAEDFTYKNWLANPPIATNPKTIRKQALRPHIPHPMLIELDDPEYE